MERMRGPAFRQVSPDPARRGGRPPPSPPDDWRLEDRRALRQTSVPATLNRRRQELVAPGRTRLAPGARAEHRRSGTQVPPARAREPRAAPPQRPRYRRLAAPQTAQMARAKGFGVNVCPGSYGESLVSPPGGSPMGDRRVAVRSEEPGHQPGRPPPMGAVGIPEPDQESFLLHVDAVGISRERQHQRRQR